jgi:ketosteroid isomerase-like protein
MDAGSLECDDWSMNLRVFAALAAIAFFGLPSTAARADQAQSTQSALAYEQRLAAAYVHNDANALANLLTSDWIVISARGDTADRPSVVDAVRKGLWVHTTMRISEPRVRIYGNTAVVTYRLADVGIFGGKPFNVQERETDVLLWSDDAWKAALSHESFVNPKH